ncbi:phosphate ABC transporter permease PstA [Chondromyces apiculatus]|uniref:Phosphate transport system permease protein PstA n=1 Tax=Chondromyces apiculatus DSM 436 TaxID=1192034 RepID=A0A017T9B6_9BACT|nr:phosphate ABC transporter permease PstA [Chondromyces apiculatus]EYF05410.1 Phosphate transport system permease protein PstA [Chondromyces apiculatus DSM 436]
MSAPVSGLPPDLPSAPASGRSSASSDDLRAPTAGAPVEQAFHAIGFLALLLPLLAFLVLFVSVLADAWPRLGWGFLSGIPSRKPQLAGILPALVGSASLMGLTALIAVPVGIGAAIYLEEYARRSRLTSLIELNISNLAGVPSIIYGLLGLEVFVRAMHLGRSLLAGALTLSLLLLPMVIMTSREALRSVPLSVREACHGLGADRFCMLRLVILPMCFPRMLTGIILALARAIGETAPLLTIGALTYVAFLPDSVHSAFSTLPLQIFAWISRPQTSFHENAAAGIVVLLAVMLLMNGFALWLRARLQRRLPG